MNASGLKSSTTLLDPQYIGILPTLQGCSIFSVVYPSYLEFSEAMVNL